ncbi:unnamed protein product [Anisakis simplex]|uniref:Tyrosine-protein kinase n=1 Tax=Anisakis simplex TaxID=6269 RepID=A0A0M3KCV9_ANISI|nr:unnamed protein product [Anisakis simplex]
MEQCESEPESKPESKRSPTKRTAVVQLPVEVISSIDQGSFVNAADKDLLSETYYHGIIEQDEIKKLLSKNGDFLICIVEGDTVERIVWAVRFDGSPRYIAIVRTADSKYGVLKDRYFDKIPDMIKYYVTTREPIHASLKITVKRAIHHKDWLISHDRVRLEEEIGKGAFGSVYKGILQVGHDFMTVAVKTYAGHARDRSKAASFLQVNYYYYYCTPIVL